MIIYEYLIGVEINLKKHLGYLGGLSDSQDGEKTMYFGNELLEIVYHISTMMPTKENDEQ